MLLMVENGARMHEDLIKMTGQKTVPSVFINGEHVGGCDDTIKLHQSGHLVPRLGEKNEL